MLRKWYFRAKLRLRLFWFWIYELTPAAKRTRRGMELMADRDLISRLEVVMYYVRRELPVPKLTAQRAERALELMEYNAGRRWC